MKNINTYLLTKNKIFCCGCTGCVAICPASCLIIEEDELGFVYPKMENESKCTNCGLCKKVCPIDNAENLKNIYRNELKKLPQAVQDNNFFAYKNPDKEILLKSSSGGAFSGIVDSFCNEETFICGVEMTEDFQVRHKIIKGKENIAKFRKSKYVKSDLTTIYSEIKKLLLDNNRVLFTGVPCQTSGLRAFLGKDYENLFIIDFTCHGVPSNKMFKSFIAEKEKEFGKKIIKFDFRNKESIEETNYYISVKFLFEDGSVAFKPRLNNEWMEMFLHGHSLMPSCLECKFSCIERISDITLADFWALEKDSNGISVDGVSLVMANTIKGYEMTKKIGAAVGDKEKALEGQEHLFRPSKHNQNKRNIFQKTFIKKGFLAAYYKTQKRENCFLKIIRKFT